jgi:hypothetical protein
MKEVNKKGMSPLIITVILVGFTLVLSTSIFWWTQESVVDTQISNIPTDWRGAEYLQFSASFSSACDPAVTYDHECTGHGATCYVLLVENEEDNPVNYIIETSGNLGVESCGPFEVDSYASKLVKVQFDNSTVGMPEDSCDGCWLEAEVTPIII